jgi:hypothetical protein
LDLGLEKGLAAGVFREKVEDFQLNKICNDLSELILKHLNGSLTNYSNIKVTNNYM